MRPLVALKNQIHACGYTLRGRTVGEDRPGELRLYLEENEPELVEAFDTTVEKFRAKLAELSDDKVGAALLTEIKRVGTVGRESSALAKANAAQETADRLGSTATRTLAGELGWVVDLDVATLFECLTKPTDVLRIETPEFTTNVFMRPLKNVAALHRKDLVAFVDKDCLTVLFGEHGRLRFRNLPDFEIVDAKRHDARFVVAHVVPQAMKEVA